MSQNGDRVGRRPADSSNPRPNGFDKVVKAQNWFVGDSRNEGLARGDGKPCGTSERTTVIYEPGDKERDLVLKGRPCMRCRFFRYEDGQYRIQHDRVSQMMMYDLKWTSMVDSLDPSELGSCLVHDGMLTAKFSTCDVWAPRDDSSKSIWSKFKDAIRFRKDIGEIPERPVR